MPTLKLERAEIYFEDHGRGFPVLLFAPGFLSSRIERWRTNPARPGVEQDWADPIPALSPRFRVVALDVRNAGRSRGSIGPGHGWHSYSEDHLALLDHLEIRRCHVMGACIGVSFALALAAVRPGMVTSLVLQNPIGLTAGNRAAIDEEYAKWAETVRMWPGVDADLLPDFGRRMFGGDFLFSVSRDFIRACELPMLIMPGDDQVHPAEISAELARLARNAEVLSPWKGPQLRDKAMNRVREFLIAHQPPES